MTIDGRAHLDRMEVLRRHHAERSERGFPTDDFHADQAAHLSDYIMAAEADFARVAKQRSQG